MPLHGMRLLGATALTLLLNGCGGADFWIDESGSKAKLATIDSGDSVTFSWDPKELNGFSSARIQPLDVAVGDTGPASFPVTYSDFYYFEGTRPDGSVKTSQSKAEVVALQEYCGDSQISLNADLWLPDTEAPAEGYPAVVFMHGGSWRDRDYSDMFQFLHRAAREGYIGVSIDYRLSADGDGDTVLGQWPNHIQDAKCAVRWLRALDAVGEINLNTDAIGAVGVSAGGNLALLLGLTDESTDPVAQERIDTYRDTMQHQSRDDSVQAVVAIAGISDFYRTWHYLADLKQNNISVPARDHALDGVELLFGAPPTDNPNDAASLPYIHNSPYFFVDAQTAASQSFLLIHGSADRLVPVSEACHLAHRLWDLGGSAADVSVLAYAGENSSHYSYQQVRNMSTLQKLLTKNLGDYAKPVLDDTFAFLNRKLKGGAAPVYSEAPLSPGECDPSVPAI
ncbi:MAG: CocE/NonD family hydrolase [Ketobacteraceae bacterium]|nr:CocE/NonD family hydrolase [Ketobacteraceae bacterium]